MQGITKFESSNGQFPPQLRIATSVNILLLCLYSTWYIVYVLRILFCKASCKEHKGTYKIKMAVGIKVTCV
jgi:hypothetical protein